MERSTAEGENYIAGGVALVDHGGRVYATHVHSWEVFFKNGVQDKACDVYVQPSA